MFEHYRALIRLRHELDVIARGSVRFLDAGPAAPKVIAYERTLGERRVVVACSFDAEPCSIADLGVSGAEVLIGSYDDEPPAGALRPFEGVAWIM